MTVIVAVALTTHPKTTRAQESAASACTPALMKDVLSYMSTDQQRFSYFSQIEEKTFTQLKRDIDTGLEVPVPLFGEMLSILKSSASYSQFAESRREYFQRLGYQSDAAREIRDFRVVTSPVAYVAWTRCIEAFAADKKTLVVFKDQEDSQTVHVRFVNRTPVSVALTSDLMNGTVPGASVGKAFADSTSLGAGGTLPVLIRRVAGGPLKLSVRSIPPFEGLFVESEWGEPPKTRLSGHLVLTYTDVRKEDRGEVAGEKWTTPNHHNQRCKRAPCSSDGQWQSSSTTLHVSASSGRYIESPVARCTGNGCGWVRSDRSPECVVVQGARSAQCTVYGGSHSHQEQIFAREYELIPIPKPAEPLPVLLFTAGQFTLRVPSDAIGAVFNYSTTDGAGSLRPGDQTSPDGKLVLLGQANDAGGTVYTYRLQ